jgi:hypothetical protein
MNEQPKTKKIKERLGAYLKLLREIDNETERLDRMELTGGNTGPNLTGMPRPKGTVSNPVSAFVLKKMELEERIAKLNADERRENAAIEAMLQHLDDPDERAVIRLRYFDRAEWDGINAALFGSRPDYIEKLDAYQRRTYRIHGRALLRLADILEASEVNDSKMV